MRPDFSRLTRLMRDISLATGLAILCGLYTPDAWADVAEYGISSNSHPTISQPLIAPPAIEIPAIPRIISTIDLTQESDDIWDRVRNGFAMPDLIDETVLVHQQWYLARPEYLRRMIERSRPYLHHIVSELELRGMPTELALLPMVESSYDPHAYSPANASGLWQFIPSTGKNYNLDQNWWIDERRDIVASTGAALDYLKTIYEMHGHWHLALASYNWGEGAVGRAIAKNIAKGLPTDYINLTMPPETRHYVPKLQALKNIFGNPTLLRSLSLPYLPNKPFFKRILTSSPIDIKLAAKLANMSLKEFLQLNPAHNRPVIKGESLLLPADRVDVFTENLERYNAPLQTWETYTLKAGDKLEKLAPRFGLPLEELKRINSLPPKVKAKPGQLLIVPNQFNRDTADSLRDWRAPKLPVVKPKPVRPVAANLKSKPALGAVKGSGQKNTATSKSPGKTSTAGSKSSKASPPIKPGKPSNPPTKASTVTNKAAGKAPAGKAAAPSKGNTTSKKESGLR